MPRYEVHFPVDIGHSAGRTDDLEEAGRIYLNTPGASDIWDHQEKRWVHPDDEIECVAAAHERWHQEQEAKRDHRTQDCPVCEERICRRSQ